jgi:DNA repair photolyase
VTRRYVSMESARALTPTGGFLSGFAYSLNPYIGCAFGANGGCPFCYVRALPVARTQPGGWGEWVVAKRNLADRLASELQHLERKGKLDRTAIFMSSATDPYQGLEQTALLTRQALEVMIRLPPRRLLLQTRSPLIERDLDLLRKLGSTVLVSLTLETDDDLVRRQLCPTSPSVARRLAAARLIHDAGIFLQLAISPMMPNHPEAFAEVAAGVCDRVVVDTYQDGDGSGGRRSAALGIPALYHRLGYDRWLTPGAEEPLMAAMRARMGAERVLFSRAGFNSI